MNVQTLTKETLINNYGFGTGIHRHNALKLLKGTIDILNEFNINYFLISGTLLGYVRHNDFIPWDDDMDLIVDEKIFTVIDEINEKYKHIYSIAKESYIVKLCLKDSNMQIKHRWSKSMINKDDNYTFPFIDLFIYNDKLFVEENINIIDGIKKIEKIEKKIPSSIHFFNKNWDRCEFFPCGKILFNGIESKIPKNPDYFLKINYGENYMKEFRIDRYSHKYERPMKIKKTLTYNEYHKLFFGEDESNMYENKSDIENK